MVERFKESKKMTVKELIKELEKANQNAKVIIVDDCRYEKDLTDVEVYNDDIVYIKEC